MKSLKNKNLVPKISATKSAAMTLGPKEKRVPVMRDHEGKPSGNPAPSAPPSTLEQHKSKTRCWEGYEPTPGKKPYEEGSCKPVSKATDKPFHGYNPKRHSKEGGLNDTFRQKYNREHGSHLKRPVTGKVKPGSKAAKRRRSFCARMSGVSGPTSKDGKLTPKGAALKRWKCKSEEVSKGGPGSGIRGHRTVKDVAAIAVYHKNKMLMGKRRDNKKYTNPGGHFDEGETPHEAAVRELKEETGISAKPKDLEHLGHKEVQGQTGRKRIHAFKLVVDSKPKMDTSKDPDAEVAKWKWIDTSGNKLPNHVKENLHSPKNVLFEKLGIKHKSLYFVMDLIKGVGGSHKYIRKYMRGGRWIYVYHEGTNEPRHLSEEAIGHIKKLAELGDEHARALHDSIEAHDERKLTMLRQLADLGDEKAHEHLGRLGIDREKEKLEEAVIPEQVRERDKSEKELSPEDKNKAISTITEAVGQAIYGHLRGHSASPYAQRLAKVPEASIGAALREKNSIKDILEELHKQMSRIDEAHRGLPQSQNTAAVQAGGYASLGYNRAIEALERKQLLPEGYSQLHRRQGNTKPEHIPFAEIEARKERERQEREDQERRVLGEVSGSMAHALNSYLERPMEPRKILEVHEVFKRMFGKNMRKEDWPYDFSDKGYNVKIVSMNHSRTGVSFEFKVTDREGRLVTDSWRREWSYSGEGNPKIYNSYLAVKSSARGTDAPLGLLINQAQIKLMKDHAPRTGKIAVTAALDVGGYNWANQGFEFESENEAISQRRRFKSFAAQHGVDLTDAELEHFKQPCHFAAFHNGKLYEVQLPGQINVSSKELERGELAPGIPLTPEERSTKKTSRMYIHLGKKFMLGNSFHGVIQVKNLNDDNEAYRYMKRFQELKDSNKQWTTLNPGYKAAVKRVGGETDTPQIVARRDTSYSPRPSSAPPMSSTRARRSPSVRRPSSFMNWDEARQRRWFDENYARMSRAQRNAARAAMRLAASRRAGGSTT